MVKKLTVFFKQQSNKGFTLLELLVVMGILAVLMAALVATLDPFEQIKKSQDTAMKDIAVEFIAANSRYYATHNALPWFTVANGGANCYAAGNTLSGIALNNLAGCITTLVTEGELKASFSTASNLNLITVSNPNPQSGNATDSIACFQPQSKSQQRDPNTKFTQTGTNGVACKSAGGANNCYWCAQ